MLCFEIKVNGEKVCTAGIGDSGVLSTVLVWTQSSKEECAARGHEWTPSETHLQVSGYLNNEHLHWIQYPFPIHANDEVCIRIMETDDVDDPSEREFDLEHEVERDNRYWNYRFAKSEFEVEGVLLEPNELDTETAIQMKRKIYEQLKKELGE